MVHVTMTSSNLCHLCHCDISTKCDVSVTFGVTSVTVTLGATGVSVTRVVIGVSMRFGVSVTA